MKLFDSIRSLVLDFKINREYNKRKRVLNKISKVAGKKLKFSDVIWCNYEGMQGNKGVRMTTLYDNYEYSVVAVRLDSDTVLLRKQFK